MHPAIGGAPFSPNSVKLMRLLRKGCANRPFFHVVIMEAKEDVKGPVIEQLGSYDPLPNKLNEKLVALNFDRIEYWLRQEKVIVTRPLSKLLGLCGYFPIHYESFQAAWENRKLIKTHLEKLKVEVNEIEKNESVKELNQNASNSEESSNAVESTKASDPEK